MGMVPHRLPVCVVLLVIGWLLVVLIYRPDVPAIAKVFLYPPTSPPPPRHKGRLLLSLAVRPP